MDLNALWRAFRHSLASVVCVFVVTDQKSAAKVRTFADETISLWFEQRKKSGTEPIVVQRNQSKAG